MLLVYNMTETTVPKGNLTSIPNLHINGSLQTLTETSGVGNTTVLMLNTVTLVEYLAPLIAILVTIFVSIVILYFCVICDCSRIEQQNIVSAGKDDADTTDIEVTGDLTRPKPNYDRLCKSPAASEAKSSHLTTPVPVITVYSAPNLMTTSADNGLSYDWTNPTVWDTSPLQAQRTDMGSSGFLTKTDYMSASTVSDALYFTAPSINDEEDAEVRHYNEVSQLCKDRAPAHQYTHSPTADSAHLTPWARTSSLKNHDRLRVQRRLRKLSLQETVNSILPEEQEPCINKTENAEPNEEHVTETKPTEHKTLRVNGKGHLIQQVSAVSI